jgi:hypothetical protein
VVEDRRAGVEWEVIGELGAVRFSGLTPGDVVPWSSGAQLEGTELVIFPRSMATPGVIDEVMNAADDVPRALVVPRDTELPELPTGLLKLTCPDRHPDIDKAIERNLLTARISRG